jgi:hypothetical protein
MGFIQKLNRIKAKRSRIKTIYPNNPKIEMKQCETFTVMFAGCKKYYYSM